MVKQVGVIGYPLAHSLSPALQQAAFDQLGYDAHYEAWLTQPERLAKVVESLRSNDYLGANVTIPYKEAVIPLLDEIDTMARRTKAVNTIVNRNGLLHGHNTDVVGFLRALREDASFDPAGARVVVLGAGGAARAVTFSLLQERADSITVVGRDFIRTTRLVEDLADYANGGVTRALPNSYDSLAAALQGCHLLINCTPVGMAGPATEGGTPLPVELIPSSGLVIDLVYNPRDTALLSAARDRGAKVLSGLAMLIYQGAASFELWTGRLPSTEVMLHAASGALDGLASDNAARNGR